MVLHLKNELKLKVAFMKEREFFKIFWLVIGILNILKFIGAY